MTKLDLVFIIAYTDYAIAERYHFKLEDIMAYTTLTVRLSEVLSEIVAENVGSTGSYENVSEYVRHLIRQDKKRIEQDAFERLQAELSLAFDAPDGSYGSLAASDIIKRNQLLKSK